jgi:hypothetical protein
MKIRGMRNEAVLLVGLMCIAAAAGLPSALATEAPPAPEPARAETGRDRARRRQRAKDIAARDGRDVEEVYRELGRAER